jgi:hypothetical protein
MVQLDHQAALPDNELLSLGNWYTSTVVRLASSQRPSVHDVAFAPVGNDTHAQQHAGRQVQTEVRHGSM